jgi:hypothetical protein
MPTQTMSYTRVIPRDLFNEANLLKCLGQLYLKLEQGWQQIAELEYDSEQVEGFDIQQSSDDGHLFVDNVRLKLLRSKINGGLPWHYILFRPLNSRDPYPLYLNPSWDSEPIPVFNDAGELSTEMVELLKKETL